MFVVFFFTFFVLLLITSISPPNSIVNNKYISWFLQLILAFSLTINIVGRPIIGDTLEYVRWFLGMGHYDWEAARTTYPTDLLFFTIQWALSRFTDSPRFMLFVFWILFLICFLKFLNKLFSYWQLSLIFFTYACFGFFYSYTTVALRQGLALSLIFLALSAYIVGKQSSKKPLILLLITASLFHWTAIPFAIIVLLYSFKEVKIKTLLFTWSITSILYVLGLQEKIISPISNLVPKVENYSYSVLSERYSGGVNRIDFLLFSAFVIVLCLFLYHFVYKNERYERLIKIYISFNIVYLWLGFLAFSDRIAGYSWMLIPVLVWMPILNIGKYRQHIILATLLTALVIGVMTGKLDYLVPFHNVLNSG